MTNEISLRKFATENEIRYIHTLERAEREGYRIDAHSHEGAPQGLYDMSVQDAAELAAEDPSLIYLVRRGA